MQYIITVLLVEGATYKSELKADFNSLWRGGAVLLPYNKMNNMFGEKPIGGDTIWKNV